MEAFHQEIQDLINHCHKADINFNVVHKNALLTFNSQSNSNNKPQQWIEQVKISLKSWRFLTIVAILLIILFAYLQLEFINTHATAIGRIILVQALPFYDWRSLKRERCLVKRSAIFSPASTNGKTKNVESDCNYCDGISSVFKLNYPDQKWNYADTTDTTQEDLVLNLADQVKSYYDIDAPIIISNTSGTDIKIDDVKNDLDYVQYVPCNIESNVYFRKFSTVEDIFSKLNKAPFYFAQWRNCNLYAMKLFRRYFPRPDYLHVNFSPIQQSWLILSKDYISGNPNYKQLKVADRLALVVVVKGHLKAKLTPISYCFVKEMCKVVIVDLYRGDALIFSDQWEIDYLLTHDERDQNVDFDTHVNLAIVLESH